jgi:uncharacterized membrane protein
MRIETMPRRGKAAAGCLLGATLLLAACGGGGDAAPDLPAPPASAAFTALPALAGYDALLPHAVSGDGSTVAGVARTPLGATQAFRWRADAGIASLGFLPGGTRSEANALSFDGAVVVGSGDTLAIRPTSSAAFRWTSGGGIAQVPALAGGLACSGSGVSGDGAIVAGTCLVSGNMGFRWTDATGSVGLGRFGTGTSGGSMALAVSRDGTAIAGAGQPTLTGAVLWRGLDPVFLGKLRAADISAQAVAVSRDGAVVVGHSTDPSGVTWPFRWTASGGLAALADPPGAQRGITPAAVSGDGSVVVGWERGEDSETAMLWDLQRGMRPLATALRQEYGLALDGWTLQRASGVSDDGRVITGHGTDPAGATRGWVVRLQP